MKLSRVLILLSFTLLFAGWLQADVDPTHFFISLNDDGSDCFDGKIVGTSLDCDGTDSGGWTGATITGKILFACPEGGCPTDNNVCVGACDFEEEEAPDDPGTTTRLGGHSDPIGMTFSLNVDKFGGGATDFQNTLGFTIQFLEIDFSLPDPAQGDSQIFTCDGGTGPTKAFDNCGIKITGDTTGFMVYSGGHVESTPEPSTWILLATAGLAIAGRRALKRA